MLKTTCLSLAVVLGIAAEANGLFMLISPQGWYLTIPGVPMSGPFNQHFVRDIGLVFLLLGAGFLIGVVRPGVRATVWATATIWLTGHALFHLWQVVVGISPLSDIQQDFMAVSLPALIGLGLTWWAFARPAAAPISRSAPARAGA